MARKTLPNKPSALIRLALADLEKTERDTLDIIDMDSWVEPVELSLLVGAQDEKDRITPNKKWAKLLPKVPKEGICTVCFAGAVMRRSLKVESASLEPENMTDRFGESIANKLFALDWFRLGRVQHGLRTLNGETAVSVDRFEQEQDAVSAIGKEIDVVKYGTSPTQFKRDMRKLATALEGHGL